MFGLSFDEASPPPHAQTLALYLTGVVPVLFGVFILSPGLCWLVDSVHVSALDVLVLINRVVGVVFLYT